MYLKPLNATNLPTHFCNNFSFFLLLESVILLPTLF